VASGQQGRRAVKRRPAVDVGHYPGRGGHLADPLQHVRLDQPGTLLEMWRAGCRSLLLGHLGSLESGSDIDGAVVLQLVERCGDRLFRTRRHRGKPTLDSVCRGRSALAVTMTVYHGRDDRCQGSGRSSWKRP
jgi:hypothetical protein